MKSLHASETDPQQTSVLYHGPTALNRFTVEMLLSTASVTRTTGSTQSEHMTPGCSVHIHRWTGENLAHQNCISNNITLVLEDKAVTDVQISLRASAHHSFSVEEWRCPKAKWMAATATLNHSCWLNRFHEGDGSELPPGVKQCPRGESERDGQTSC